MTRKDYVRFAALLKSHECPMGSNLDRLGGWNDAREDFVERLADMFEAESKAFDRKRFMKAASWRVAS